jgi:Flp pilus assembly protein TadD
VTRHRPLAISLCALAAVLAGTGCSGGSRRSGAAYQTVAQDPGRDADTARRENDKAVEWIEKRDWGKAEELLKSALVADVTFGPAHNNLGKVYFQTGRYYLAAWEFQYATKLMPDQPQPRNNLALVLEAVGKLDDAVRCYDEALALAPDNAQVIGNAARARIRRGDRDAQVVQLLSKLVLCDTRPDWVEWAKERLALYRPDGKPLPATTP